MATQVQAGNGRPQVSLLEPGRPSRSLRLRAGGFPGLQGSFWRVLQIEPGTTVKQDITVEPASTIQIKIQDANGRPLANTFVDEEGRAARGPRRSDSPGDRFMGGPGCS